MGKTNLTSQPQLGQRLFEIRSQQGLTQQELREKSHVSIRTIQRIESGAVTPRSVTTKILLEALGENLDDWYNSDVSEEQASSKTLSNMLLVSASEPTLKQALLPAWISGIIYLLMVIFEQSIEIFTENSANETMLQYMMVIVKVIAAISFFLFTKGILSLSILFEVSLLKTAAYISLLFVPVMYLTEGVIILYFQELNGPESTFRALSVIPLGTISVFLGIGLKRLQDGMGRLAKVAGNLELVFGISYMSLIFSFVGVLILVPLLVVEVVLLSKADQLARAGEI